MEKLAYSYNGLRKKVVFLVSSGKNEVSSFFAPLENSFASLEKTTISRPG